MKKTSKRTSGSPKRSRRPPASAREVALGAFATVARAKRLRWYVFGAQAVNLYGFPRMTADIDITIDLGRLDTRSLVAALERGGFEPRIPDDEFIAHTRVVPIVHRATRFPIDVVLAGPGLEQQFLAGARAHRLGGHDIPVISPEHLVVTKVLAGRPKDLEDVRELLAVARPRVRQIESLLAQLEEALGQSDLLPRFRALRSERKRGR